MKQETHIDRVLLDKNNVILYGVPVYLIITIVFFLFYFILAKNSEERLISKGEKAILMMKGKQENALLEIQEDLYFLSNLQHIKNWSSNKKESTKDLNEFMRVRTNYDHLRIIDLSGQEVVRINNKKSIRIVDSTHLQMKGNKDYFEESTVLKQNEFYSSPISLNRENGKIEVPYNPVFRVLTPLYNKEVKTGYICINYKVKNLLNNFDLGILPIGSFDIKDANNNFLTSLLGEKTPKAASILPESTSEKEKYVFQDITTYEDEHYRYMATPLSWSSNTTNKNADVLRQNESSNQQFTLFQSIPKRIISAASNDILFIFISAFLLFSLFYIFTLRYLYLQRRKSLLSEVQFQSIFNKTSTFINLLTPDGILLEVNDTALQFGGFTREQAVGMKFWEAPWWSIDGETKKQLQQAITQAGEGNEVQYDVDILGGKGEIITIDFTLNPVIDKKGTVIHLITEGKNITERKGLHDAMEEQNLQFRSMQQLSRTGAWSVNIKTNEVFWDDMVYNIHEEPTNKIITLEKGIEYYREDHRPIINKVLETAIEENKPWDVESVIISATGKEKWVRSLGYPVFEENQLIALRGTFTDIDVRKRQEQHITENEKQLRLALQTANLGLWDWKIQEDQLNWDESTRSIFDVEKENVPNTISGWEEHLHPEDLETFKKAVENSLQATEDLDIEFRIQTQENTVRYIKCLATLLTEDSEPKRLIGVCSDISARIVNRQKIEELNQSLEEKVLIRTKELIQTKSELEQQLNLLGVTAMVSETNLRGEIMKANASFCKKSGYSLEELVGARHSKLKSNVHSKEMYDNIWLTISQGGTWQGELCNKNKNGELYWVHATLQPFLNENGEISRYVGVFFDVTELKTTSEQLASMNRRLDTANKELETFSYSVSHDLKAPLRALQGFSKNLVKNYSDSLDETGVRWLHFIQDNASRMDTLIADILSFSRINKAVTKKDKFDMRHIIEHKADTLKQVYKKPHEITIADNLPNITSDQSMIEMVWQNLLDNAFKYSQKKEFVSIAIWAEEKDSHVTYFIKDNGNGFDMKYYDKIFGVFQRLHSNEEFEGTGVGLANVHRIIQKHKGSIEAYSEPNKGATFQFSLPKK